ncbi:Na+/H+ antiporter NhaA [Microbacterium protaetiae]|uniref:Na(+)/H(+) antiporter NhaA n=1 Tax=Microbacterium protaetiae TaxID=2509458 RepID=A0A4P6ESF1_9MICO|nr:Na+/H+ antiporter NhaA [Microbacterium protaetiae]QAY60898.1 Na+/H+ antiporter NhaA [Microbacterium protaetiae]
MTHPLRSPRLAAVLLLVAAGCGLALANSPASSVAFAVQHFSFGPAGTPFALDIGAWIADGLLTLFFFTVAVELQFELTAGQLRSARNALLPAIAAAGGVLVPIVVYLAVAAPSGLGRGWPVPTATDIAFALGVLAVFGRGLPARVRVFLLALAILDDIIGIVFIAVLFARDVNVGMLLLALVLVVAFGVLSRALGGRGARAIVAAMIVLAIGAWAAMLASGVHATIAGVLLGLAASQRPGMRVAHVLEPWVNGVVLPLFALSAALVTIPRTGSLSPVFWGIAIALPVGKLIGITGTALLAQRVLRVAPSDRIRFADLLAAAALGGIGFTVSLLLAGLAFADAPELRDQAVLGVLCGSLTALVVSAFVVSWRARAHRRQSA